MTATIKRLLERTKGDVAAAAELFGESTVLLTVPHAYSLEAREHDRDFAAVDAARVLEGAIPGSLVHLGDLDRHREADLNRETTELSEDWHWLVRTWIALHPRGRLVDVHSFPKGFNWNNKTTTLTSPTRAADPVVVLLPVANREFALSVARGITDSVYQGTRENALINMGCKKSVLLEFEEGDARALEYLAGVVARRIVLLGV